MKIVKKSSDFQKIYRGKSFYTHFFRVHYLYDHDNDQTPCFGFTVSKKAVSKKAVDRNLVKRRFKEAFRQFFDFSKFNGYKFVITSIRSTKDATWQDYVDCVKFTQKRLQNTHN